MSFYDEIALFSISLYHEISILSPWAFFKECFVYHVHKSPSQCLNPLFSLIVTQTNKLPIKHCKHQWGYSFGRTPIKIKIHASEHSFSTSTLLTLGLDNSLVPEVSCTLYKAFSSTCDLYLPEANITNPFASTKNDFWYCQVAGDGVGRKIIRLKTLEGYKILNSRNL